MAKRRGQGEGTICQLEDGSWVAVLDFGQQDGKRIRRKRRAPTKRQALVKLEELKRARDAGAVPAGATVERWLNHWLDDIVDPSVKAGDLKASTAKGYRSHVEQWLVPHLGIVKLERLGPSHVRALHATMREAGKSEATIRNAHAALRRALVVAVADRALPRLPFGSVSAPTPRGRYRILTEADAAKVLSLDIDTRTRARLHVAILGGVRQGEALALRWEHITDTHLLVRASAARIKGAMALQETKSATSVRDVPLSPALAEALAAWRKESGGKGYVFHGFRGPRYIEGSERDHRAWKSALSRAGVEAVPLHGARGTCATLLQNLGVPPRVIADYLGQSTPTVTMDHYLHSDDSQRTEAARKLGELTSQPAG